MITTYYFFMISDKTLRSTLKEKTIFGGQFQNIIGDEGEIVSAGGVLPTPISPAKLSVSASRVSDVSVFQIIPI